MSESGTTTGSFARASLPRWQSQAANPVAWGIIAVVAVVVTGAHFLAVSLRPSHMKEIADELGSVSMFSGKPFGTEDGAFLSFSRGTRSGNGLYVRGESNGVERLVYEDSGSRRQSPFGWSPDGNMLAFVGGKDDKNELMVYNGKSEQIEFATALYGPVTEFGWLSSSSFVFFKGDPMHLVSRKQNTGLMRMTRHSDGTWGSPSHFAKPNTGAPGEVTANSWTPLKGLMTTSPESVAWVAGNAIWELRFHQSEPAMLWDGANTNKVLSCSYSAESEAFLLRLRKEGRHYLATYRPAIQRFVDLGDLLNTNAVNVSWANHGKGYAYLVNDADLHCIFVKANMTNDVPPQCVRQDATREFTVAGNSIYSLGSLEGQPEGVVEYNVASGSSEYVVSDRARFRFATNELPVNGVLTNSSGEIHAYRLWKPVKFDPQKKYPLVLAQQRNFWNERAQAAANAGAFYISVDRRDFSDPQINHWTEDVMAAWRLMSRDANIDTNKLFLSGSSTETKYVSDLLNEEPGLWKGAILSNPVALPDASRIGVIKLLIINGESSNDNNLTKIRKFQQEASRAGIPVTVAAVSTGHNLVSVSANKAGTQEFLRFIFE